MTLTEFLLARIAEDEVAARGYIADKTNFWEQRRRLDGWRGDPAHKPDNEGYSWGCTEDPSFFGPGCFAVGVDRVLAECEAKRRIIELHHPKEPDGCDAWNDGRCIMCVKFHADMDCEQMAYPCPTIRALAQPYAVHPDFDPEWKL